MCPWSPKPPKKRPTSTSAYRRLAARVYSEEDYCGICGCLVDKTLKHPDPWSKTMGHIVSVGSGGPELDRNNVELQHRKCNLVQGEA